jgi:hypothetical protein
MTTRLDTALQKYPEHEKAIRLLAERDPSSKLKYLDWGAKMLASGQALAPEIADVLDLFHRFAGQRLDQVTRTPGVYRRRSEPGQRVHPDIHTYQPKDLAKLRDLLLEMKRAADSKRKQREKLYHIEGTVEADVIYDSDDLIVRHIKNKQASAHYGRDTKWCISMLREGYFEDYEAHNATFFFFERKTPKGDEYDKVALVLPRTGRDDEHPRAFTTLDQPADMMVLAKVHGPRVFDIFRQVYEASENYPGSSLFQVYSGTATIEQIQAVVHAAANVGFDGYVTHTLLVAVCCNDATPWLCLQEIERSAYKWSLAAGERRRRPNRAEDYAKQLVCSVLAALLIHPQTPTEERKRLTKELRKRRIPVDAIRRVNEGGGRIAISWGQPVLGGRYRRQYYRRRFTVKTLRERAAVLDRAAMRTRKKARTLERNLAEKKRQKEKREKAKTKTKQKAKQKAKR